MEHGPVPAHLLGKQRISRVLSGSAVQERHKGILSAERSFEPHICRK
jgi:hypothetical protein